MHPICLHPLFFHREPNLVSRGRTVGRQHEEAAGDVVDGLLTFPDVLRATEATPAPVSDSLSYDDWIRDDWVRSSSVPIGPGTAAQLAEGTHGAS